VSEDKKSIGIKIHDIHHGLVQATGAIVETHFSFLKEIGSAIQIATTIKDHEVINDIEPFYAAAGELKIPRSLAKEALVHLEKLGFTRLKWDTGKNNIARIDIVIPELPQIYNDFGDYFQSESTSPIADYTVNLLDKLSLFPHKERDIVSQLPISERDYSCIKDIGKHTSIVDTYISPKDSESIIYSPIYWDDNPKSIFSLLEKYCSLKIAKAMNIIKQYQGISGDSLNEEVLRDAIKIGCFPALSVTSSSGLKKFIFTPQFGVNRDEKTLLHKARVLLSCVRYGENFAGITRINNPHKLIGVLSGRGFLREHSESLRQYESARNHGLVKIIPTSDNRHEVHFVDNEENKKVVDMALEMLTIGEATKHDNSQEIAKKILLPGSLQHPIQTRTYILRTSPVKYSSTTLEKINDVLRGIDV